MKIDNYEDQALRQEACKFIIIFQALFMNAVALDSTALGCNSSARRIENLRKQRMYSSSAMQIHALVRS